MNGRGLERVMLQEAVMNSAAQESIGRRLGDELIAASREAVAAWHEGRVKRMLAAIEQLEQLVGRP